MELSELNFDVCQRFRGIIELVGKLGLKKGQARLLDVGGYPGTLADLLPEYRVITSDIPPCPRDHYVSASASELPFGNDKFEVVISSDTLEHVAAEARSRFLVELLRVSRRWLILAAPFKSKPVEFCEEKINGLHIRYFNGPHPWLEEHIRLGLPVLNEVIEHIESQGCSYRTLGNAEIMGWFIMWLIHSLCELLPEATPVYKEFNGAYNYSWSAPLSAEISYRKILVINKAGEDIDITGMAQSAEEAAKEQLVLEKLNKISRLAFSIAERIWQTKQKRASPADSLALEQYVEKLEKIIAVQETATKGLEDELESTRGRLDSFRNHPLIKIINKIVKIDGGV